MAKVDYRGARGSNAGDDFHELWALRQALTLLDTRSKLLKVTVEGLTAEDEEGTSSDSWDGVDCAFYYGDDRSRSYERIVIAQLKYSAADSAGSWTVARLSHSTKKKGNNSVINRLATAFASLKSKYPDLAQSGNLTCQFVSNQKVAPEVVEAFSDEQKTSSHEKSKRVSDRSTLQAASGLSTSDFEVFSKALDFSQCGHDSRFSIEERILSTISEWTENDARSAVNDLLMFIRRKMLPEASGEEITRHSIIASLGFSDPAALFPCPSSIKQIDRIVPRQASKDVVTHLLTGKQRICLYGEGGCGKTTALQELEGQLPEGSMVITFDCYGGGRYLDADAYRHRPKDAFLQLSNDLAVYLRTPLLLNQSLSLDYPRVFKKRLENAAAIVRSQNNNALLVVCVDAADNSIIAASSRSPQEHSFVHDFINIGELPDNVRFVTTCRTGRLETLELPRDFIRVPITGFNRDETAGFVRGSFHDVPDEWVDDFHSLSGGNPRVQRYVIDLAGSEPKKALDYLRPNGKLLDQVFLEQFSLALKKGGNEEQLKILCAALISLARPIPIGDLSVVTGLPEAHVRDICTDLAPGVRIAGDSLSFADEDFEQFVRSEGDPYLSIIYPRIADYFVSRYKVDAYAATHIAGALLAAGRRSEIIHLVKTEPVPEAINDPMLQRETQLQRLRIAMKVCRETGNNIDAMMTLLIGAEALKTDTTIHQMLVDNPDLAAAFTRDTVSRAILRNPDEIKEHGPILFHLMAVDARQGDAISVREGCRMLDAWLQARREDQQREKSRFPDNPHLNPPPWSIDILDITAETEAILRTQGPQQCLDMLSRWRPHSIAAAVASLLSFKLITSGESSVIKEFLAETKIGSPWNLFLLVPLALAGEDIDLSVIGTSLSTFLHRNLIRPDKLLDEWDDKIPAFRFLDMIVTACETIVARRGDTASVIPILERIVDRVSRRRNPPTTQHVSLIDFGLRAHTLLERLAGRRATFDTYWVDQDEPAGDLPPRKKNQAKRSHEERKRELRESIEPLMDIYDIRAQALLGIIKPEEIEQHLQPAISRYTKDEYRFTRQPHATYMRTRVALSITRLMILSGLSRISLIECASTLLGSNSSASAEADVLSSLALDKNLHQRILSVITARASAVRGMKTSSEDKISTLTTYARLILPFSVADAQSLFNMAIDVAGEVNADSVHELALLEPLAENATSCMSAEEKRAVACDLSIIVGDTAVRLSDNDHFPWEKIARALGTLDIPIALAATARWEDLDIIGREDLLPGILATALEKREIAPEQAAAFSPLVDNLTTNFIGQIIEGAIRPGANVDPNSLAEHLAQEELLRFGQGTRREVTEKLNLLLSTGNLGIWMNNLAKATIFHEETKPVQTYSMPDGQTKKKNSEQGGKEDAAFDVVTWKNSRFVTPDEIITAISLVQAASHESGNFIRVSDIFDKVGSVIRLEDRVAHLEALTNCRSANIPGYEIPLAIARRLSDWQDSPSVIDWQQRNLLSVSADFLSELSRWLPFDGDSQLPILIKRSGATNQQICTSLLDSLERHVDEFSVPTIYALVGFLGQYYIPKDTAGVLIQYVRRLVNRIPVGERDNWNPSDIPVDTTSGIARYLYSLMGDIDIRIRWRAAHALRYFALFGNTHILDAIIDLFGRTEDVSYRNPSAPFYWLSARLWLVIALDRIAAEKPDKLASHAVWLFDVATNNEFPHIIIRSFAKATALKLFDSGNLVLDSTQQEALRKANTSPVGRKKPRQPSYSVGFDRHDGHERENQRFHFNSMDTLPYWYTGVLRSFADVGPDEFLVTAESWIVDRWEVQNDPWRWTDEPRKYRLTNSKAQQLSHHSHGSRPILERFHTYLELHAMWCVVGELMQTRALTTVDEEDYDSFEYLLKGDNLTFPPLWLADLCSPKPLESRFWSVPAGSVDLWVDGGIRDDEFLEELGLPGKEESIVIEGHLDTRSTNFMSSVEIHSALVSPETAGALARALQTVDDAWSYRIPKDEDDIEIKAPPYNLLGWLVYGEGGTGIDDHDPLRYGVDAPRFQPSKKTAKALNLRIIMDNRLRWIDARRGNTAFLYEAWGDTRGDEQEERYRHDFAIRSSGERLWVYKESLTAFLKKRGLDLIIEIEITRRNSGYDSSGYDDEKKKESRFDKVIILRRDGTIEGAEGHLGSWTISRP